MAELAALAAYLQTLKPQTPCLEMEPSSDLMNNFTFSDQDPCLNFPFMMNLPIENFTFNQGENLQGMFQTASEQSPLFLQMDSVKSEHQECNSKRKRKTVDVSESSSGTASSDVRTDTINNSGRSRRRKTDGKEEEKSKEVVHVRARRGQATDSHSLAERVRRGKINERLKCLQNIVPGCYKAMGMAVMLDEIINYVQSLQNQVEFLSMKLAAASSFYDFNSEQEMAVESMEERAKDMERLMRIGHGGQATNITAATATATWQP